MRRRHTMAPLRAYTMNVVQKLPLDGPVEAVSEKMTLEQMQQFVGGDIELVRTRLAHRALIVNENGVAEELAVNHDATRLVAEGVNMLGGIRGSALLVKA
jgi:Domain of unknown function (DUF3846)